MKVVRDIAGKIVMVERIIAFPEFYTARVYEKQINMADHDNRIDYNGAFYGDVCYRPGAGEKVYKEIYRLIDDLFPELNNKGLKSDGYVKYSKADIQASGLKFS